MAKKSRTYKGARKPFGATGWYNESRRHSLSARGIRTGKQSYRIFVRPEGAKKFMPTNEKFDNELDAQTFAGVETSAGMGETYIVKKDTDGDGVPDSQDCDPIDPKKQDEKLPFKKLTKSKMTPSEVGIVLSANNQREKFDGSWNYMQRGKLISQPSFLLRQKGTNTLYGSFEVQKDHLDRVIYLSGDMTISEQEEYKMRKKPSVYLYGFKINKLYRREYKFDGKDWKNVGTVSMGD